MAFVLDCSVTMAWVFSDEANESTDALRESLIKDSAVVPVLWPIEVGNVLLVATRRGRITEDDWPRIRDDLEILPIDVDPESFGRVLETVLPIAKSLSGKSSGAFCKRFLEHGDADHVFGCGG